MREEKDKAGKIGGTAIKFLSQTMEQPKDVLGQMAAYRQYHPEMAEREYVVGGSIVGCSLGTELSRLDLSTDHGVYDRKGNPVMVCSDCKAGVNVYSFGMCKSLRRFDLDKRCRMAITGEWKEAGDVHTHIWSESEKCYKKVLTIDGFQMCLHGYGLITIREINGNPAVVEGSGEEVELSPWLFGYKGEPSRTDISHVIEGNGLFRTKRKELGEKNKLDPYYQGMAGIDWYSFMPGAAETLSEHYKNSGKQPTLDRISDKKPIQEVTYILVNDEMRYWVGVGPEVAYENYHVDYPGSKATLWEEQFEFGTEIDVVLRHEDDSVGTNLVYIPCIFGMMKAHTYAGDYVNGVFQTGTPYPYSESAGEDGSKNRDGSYIEFLRALASKNGPDEKTGIMSKYTVEKIIVYKRGWKN